MSEGNLRKETPTGSFTRKKGTKLDLVSRERILTLEFVSFLSDLYPPRLVSNSGSGLW